ncbi:AAA family ATPase [Tumebacillus sp. ITR2]|uniref:AAA family ATPase n=2 Tax=Tumebacillus amylolyticus TaxID=2801339 RepID=A0ABS1J4U1_9BACL|nr:AAA family ATPase [Tumebacillus amylolyticus]
MRIERLVLENFRGFERREITFSEQFTVLIGDNGSGKSTILDGLAVALGSFMAGIEGREIRTIQSEEVRQKKIVIGEITTMEPQLPTRVVCTGTVEGRRQTWDRSVLKVNTSGAISERAEYPSLITYAEGLREIISAGKEIKLPLLSYYGTGRMYAKKPAFGFGKRAFFPDLPTKPGSRVEGYFNCLSSGVNWRRFESWFRDKRMIELQKQTELEILQAVRNAVSNSFEKWNAIEYDFDTKEVVAIDEEGIRLPFDMLSDGMRNMLGMVADIAYRMATLNPHLRDRVIQETPGVVLIDELDLHLHPVWQRKVVDDLKRTFPNVQFIVTTHSPFIVQSLSEGELRWLQKEDDDERVEAEKYVNRSLEDIAENVMEIPFPLAQRSHHLQNMYEAAQQYYDLLDQAEGASPEEIQRLKQKLDELSAPYSDNVAYYAFLERKRLKAGLGRDDDETD